MVFVVGAMAHGKVAFPFRIKCISVFCLQQVEVDYVEDEVAISGYPLSAALTCAKLCTAFEEAWSIQ